MMRAITRTKYGKPDVLEFREIDKPVPNDVRGVLIKVYASSVNAADHYTMLGPIFARFFSPSMGLRKPKNPGLGSDVAGIVESVAPNISEFKAGDEVFGVALHSYAEYAISREKMLALKPSNCSFEDAAASGIAAITALQALRDQGGIKSGQKVLINGAGGGVGTFAVMIAKSYGAEVTAVTSPDKVTMVRSIGADHVIDYTLDDFGKIVQRYDLICDLAATHSISQYKRLLNPDGICVIVGLKNRIVARLIYYMIAGRFSRSKKFKFFIAKNKSEDYALLGKLLQAGKIKPVIDSRYQLSETAPAIRHFEEGKTRGKIIISVADSKETEPTAPESRRTVSVTA